MKQIFLIFCLFFAFLSSAQTLKFRFDGSISNIDAGKKEGGVTVSVIQGGATLFSSTSASNGRYVLSGDINYSIPFEVVFSKSGFVGKKVAFDFVGLNEEDTPAGAEFKPVTDLSIDLFGERPNVDFSFLKTQPVGQFKWNAQKFAADLNSSEAAKIKTKIDKLLLDAEKNNEQAEANYNAAIAEADKQYAANNHEAALAKYEEALSIKPKEKHPIDRILELDAIIQKKKEAELANKQENAEYYNLIQAADNFRNAKEYDKAVAKYNEALAKKEEQYPKDEIKKIEALLKEKENQAAYQTAIETGDMLLKQKSYKAAKDQYLAATKLKPSEQYPKTKLAELEAKIQAENDLLSAKKKYEDAVAAADKLFTEEKWEESKVKYQEALAIESASTYVSGRIKLIDETLAKEKAEKEKLAQIEKLLSEGAAAFTTKKYDEALSKYKAVIGLDAANAIATTKIPEIEQLIADAAKNAAMEAEFLALVKKGDDALVAKKLPESIGFYEQALALKQDAPVQAKLDAVKKQLEDLKNAEQLQAEYTKLITEGKSLFDAKDYEQALTKYEAAKVLKPLEKVPQTKIDEINAILKQLEEQNQKNAQLTALLSEGEALFVSESWEASKAKFTEVLKIEATHPTAIAKIKAIDAKLAELKMQADKDAQFTALVTKGDQEATAEKLTEAITSYQGALKLKSDAVVEQKIATLQTKIQELEGNKQRLANYEAAIKEGDKLFSEKKYELSKASYEKAITFNSTENYPKGQIVIIDKLLSEQAELKAKQAEIQKLLEEGQTLLSAKNYEPAKAIYERVLGMEATNSIAQAKISEINAALASAADQAAKEKLFNDLKQEGLDLLSQEQLNPSKTKFTEALKIKDDADIKKKIAEIDAKLKEQADKEAKIALFLSEGKKQFDAKSYAKAKLAYEDVLRLAPTNEEANAKIAAINDALNAQMNEAQQLVEFNKLKKEGMDLAVSKEYDAAKSKLKQALQIKEDAEVIAKIKEIEAIQEKEQGRIAEINALLSEGQSLFSATKFADAKTKYQAVLAMDGSNVIAKEKIALIDAELAKLMNAEQQNAAFEKLKKEGFDFAAAKNYSPALSKLEQALLIKEDASVRQKIEEIKNEIAAQSQNAALDDRYASLLEQGQSLATAKNYADAIKAYTDASALKPSEQLPKQKITELKALLLEQSKNTELDAKYQAFLDKGDNLVSSKDYAAAITAYNEALALKPTEKLPVEKAKNAQLLADASSKNDFEAQYEKILATTSQKIEEKDYIRAKELIQRAMGMRPEDERPKTMLNQILALEKRQADFDALMQKAAVEGSAKNYDKAINLYEQAKVLIPENIEPTRKIEELRRLMNAESSMAEKENLFKQFISEGDAHERSAKYELALNSYQNALNVKPEDIPTREKISALQRKIEEIANNNQLVSEQQKQFNAFIKEADGFFNTGNSYQEAIDRYSKALTIFPENSYAKSQLIESQKRSSQVASIEVEKEYRKIITVADRYFTDTDYTKAAEYYNRALSLRAADPYPKKKLLEIDGILNPASQTGPMLIPLGEAYDNSIMDGSQALAIAEQERKNLKTSRVKTKLNNIGDAEVETTAEKTSEHQQTSNEIYSFYRQIAQDGIDANLNHQATIEAVRKGEIELATIQTDNQNYKSTDILNSQDQLYDVEKSHELEYGERESVYTQNDEEFKKIKIAVADEHISNSSNYYAENLTTNTALDVITSEHRSDYIDNQNKRIAEANKVEGIRTNSQNSANEIASENYGKNISNEESVNRIYQNYSIDAVEKSFAPGDNNENLKEIRYVAIEQDVDNQESQHQNVLENDQHVTTIYSNTEKYSTEKSLAPGENNDNLTEIRYVASDQNEANQDNQHQNVIVNKEKVSAIEQKTAVNTAENELIPTSNHTNIKGIGDEAIAQTDSKSVDQKQTSISNDVTINKYQQNQDQDGVARSVNRVENAVNVDAIGVKAQGSTVENNYTDEAQRLSFQSKADVVKIEVDAKNSVEQDKPKDNLTKVTDISKSATAESNNTANGKQQAIYDTKKSIEGVKVERQASPVIKNSLGEEYPEGVSQEVFQRKDENGIMKAIITRRVVVVEGRGDVYVKTETIDAITYSKNDVPINETVWQKETQAAHLKRNY